MIPKGYIFHGLQVIALVQAMTLVAEVRAATFIQINQFKDLVEEVEQTPSTLNLESLFSMRRQRNQSPRLLHQFVQNVEIHNPKQEKEDCRNANTSDSTNVTTSAKS